MIGFAEGAAAPEPEPPPPPPLEPRVAEIFGENGLLVSQLGLEYRPEQETMACAVARTLEAGEPLLFEAGTGVGKSLAYLIPSLLFAQEHGRQGIVSTHTIALQEQVQHKDLRLCRKLFAQIPELQPLAQFRTALLVGRGNYLCPQRLAEAMATRSELFETTEEAELQRIVDWSQQTQTGLLQELNPKPRSEVWEWVSADGSGCNRHGCNAENCFYRRAKEAMAKAHLVIVNHSLLFALLGAGQHPRNDVPGVLLPHDFAVLDEAHTVAEVATAHFGHKVSSYGLERVLGRILSIRRNGKPKGQLVTCLKNGDVEAMQAARAAAKAFFDEVHLRFLETPAIARLREAGWTDLAQLGPLHRLVHRLQERALSLDEGRLKLEISGLKESLEGQLQTIDTCVRQLSEEHVYWAERSGRRSVIISLNSAPIDVAPQLRERLFERKTGVLLTSATLARGEDMASFQSQVGAWGVSAERVASPFDYERHLRVFIADDAPAPDAANAARLNHEYLADMIGYCCLRHAGGSLVLFTSHADLTRLAGLLAPRFGEASRPFLWQGDGLPRSELVRRLKAAGNGILFGTDSFWTGIDVPGPALSQVILTRLPFTNPTHPIAEAQAEHCRARGGNPFADITLPEALIQFRQGIGRLIRHTRDQGAVTILDPRILTKPYGRRFLGVLPQRKFTRLNRGNRDAVFFFNWEAAG